VSSPSSLAVKYKVLTKCTVRAGKGGKSEKIGEYQKGQVLEVVEESTNKLGLAVVRTTTPPNGADTGGWVKMRTNKGKVLLEKMQAARSNRRMSISQSDMQLAQSQGIELVQEELIDLVISGTGPLGLRFGQTKGSDANSPGASIEVKYIVPGSIASAIPDLSVGQMLRMVDGKEVGSYSDTMKMIGDHWRSQEQMTLSLANPAEDSEEEHEDDVGEDSRGSEDTLSAPMEAENSDTAEKDDSEHVNGAEESTAPMATGHSARARRSAIPPQQQDTVSPLPVAPATRVSKGPAGRRASVSEVGVGEVGSLAEGIATELGAIREKVFLVNQDFIKKARPLCELKVGGMGLVLLDGPNVLDTLLYQVLTSWQYVSSGVKFNLKPGTSHYLKYGKSLFFGTSEGKQICELMNSHAVNIHQREMADGPRSAPTAHDQAEEQNRQFEQLGPVKNWRATLMKPTKFKLCNQDGTPKHDRWFWCKPDNCGIVWSKAANGSGKIRTVKSVMLGFADHKGGASHSTLGFTIVTSQGDEIKLIADDAVQRRQWTAACQVMLRASEPSKIALSPRATAAARAVYVNHVSAWLKKHHLTKYHAAILNAFENTNLPPREWVAMLDEMAADDGLDEFIQSIARTTGDREQEVVAQQEQLDAETGGVELGSAASDDSFADQVDELERLAEEMQGLDEHGDDNELERLAEEMQGLAENGEDDELERLTEEMQGVDEYGEDDELERLTEQMQSLDGDGEEAGLSAADNSLVAGLEELLE
jgi:hypothetical protein